MVDEEGEDFRNQQIFKDTFTEQERGLFMRLPDERIEDYKEIFDIFDESGDGSISSEEIGQVMQGLG